MKNGNKLGTTLFAHNLKPDLLAIRLLFENNTKLIVNSINKIGSINLLKETVKNKCRFKVINMNSFNKLYYKYIKNIEKYY